MTAIETATFACGCEVPESATKATRDSAPHWLCPKHTAVRNGHTWHDWTEEEIYFERRRNIRVNGGETHIVNKKWAPQECDNPTMHYQWIEIPASKLNLQ